MWRDPDRGPAKHGGVLFIKISVTSSFGEEGLPCTHGDRVDRLWLPSLFGGVSHAHMGTGVVDTKSIQEFTGSPMHTWGQGGD